MASSVEVLGTWIAECSSDHSELAYQRAQIAVLDTIACILAGEPEPSTQSALTAIASWGQGKSTLVSGGSTTPPWAALVNGTAAHALDYDDYDSPSASHPSAVLIPAIFALGEELCVSGRELLDAYIIGLEVMARMGMAANVSHYSLGWHATATIGAIGSAAACARLMKLDAVCSAAALGLSTSMASGYHSQFGTMAKPLHAGLAAKSGLMSASLAAAGATAGLETLDGEKSFLSLTSKAEPNSLEQVLETLGDFLSIEKYGVILKPYPCCGYIHRALNGFLQLRQQHQFTAADVSHITINMADRNASVLTYPHPKSSIEARNSLEFCIALALLTGTVSPEGFTETMLQDSTLTELISLIELKTYPADPNGMDCSPEEPYEVLVVMKDKQQWTISVAYPPGSLANPMAHDDIVQKFRQCAKLYSHRIDVESLETALLRLENIEDINTITSLLG